MSLVSRNLEKKINKLLDVFPAIALIGSRQTGKTALSKKLRPDWRYLDLENTNDFELISRDSNLYFEQFSSYTIFDEAQAFPALFNNLRGVIDKERNKKGRFIITGSSSPELLSHISETLAGRIAVVEIGTLKANEYYQMPLSPFYQIFDRVIDKDSFQFGDKQAPLANAQMREIWLKGGYPEPLLTMNDTESQFWMEAYRDSYINRDVARLFPKLDKVKYQRFISMLAKLSGTIVNKSDIGRSLEFSESAARDYLYIADKTFVWREILSYDSNVIKSLVKMPKGHIRDSGLLHFLLGIQDFEALYNHPNLGVTFESFIIEEVLKGLTSTYVTNWQPYYYRTRGGIEVDLILEGPFGVLPIEIKHGTSVNSKQLTSINRFVEDHKLEVGLLINQASEAMWLNDKIYQLPIGWL